MEFTFLDDAQQRVVAEFLVEYKETGDSEVLNRMTRYMTGVMRPRSTKFKFSKKAVAAK